MCGFGGYVDLDRSSDSHRILDTMVSRIKHRGPDEQRTRSSGEAHMAHTRLSILDLASSHQPMADGEKMLAFNGELYNYKQLRNKLFPSDTSWQTDGDTEVLLKLLSTGNLDHLLEIEGMFAFAIWDNNTKELILGRDRFGKKPLFYSLPSSKSIVFGSEPKALLAHPQVSDELDPASIKSALTYRAVYGTGSMYAKIHQVQPGECLIWKDGNIRTYTYFNHTDLFNHQVAQPDLLQTLEASVKHRLVSDVPVGAFLSGGIDSSIIVALMRRALGDQHDIRTYSVSFEGDTKDENPYASAVAKQFNTTHNRTLVRPQDFLDHMGRLSTVRDAPLSEPADIPIALMSKRASEDVKVVLSGEGADEAYAGYPKYMLAGLPWAARAFFNHLPMKPTLWLGSLLGVQKRRLRIALESLQSQSEIENIRRWFAVADEQLLNSLFPDVMTHPESNRCFHTFALEQLDKLNTDRIQNMQYVDLLTWLPGNLLERGDRMTMSAGLEARMPFMSPEVIALGLQMKPGEKASLKHTKKPLRDLCDQVVNRDIARRQKWGFRAPLEQWFTGPFAEPLQDSIRAKDSFCNSYGELEKVDRLIAEHQSGQHDHQGILWSIFTLEQWYRDRSRTAR